MPVHVERRTERRIAVLQHVTALAQPSGRVVDSLARHRSDPGFCRLTGDAGKRDAPGLQIEKEQDVVGRQPTSGQHLDSEEVAARMLCVPRAGWFSY
jgi:hypothetical protein